MLEASAKTQTNTKQKCNSSATILHYYCFTGFSTRSATVAVTDPGGGGREGCALRENEMRRRLTSGYFGQRSLS